MACLGVAEPRGQTNIHATEGKRAPAFTLPSQTGDAVALASYLGRQPVVLVFYMGDFEAGVVSSSGAATAPGSISGSRGRRHGHQY